MLMKKKKMMIFRIQFLQNLDVKKEILNLDDLQVAVIPKKRGRPVKNYQMNEAEHIPLTNAIPVISAMNRLLSPLFRRTASDQIVPTPF